AALTDFSAWVLRNLTPLGAIDDAIATAKDSKATTIQKVNSVVSVLPALLTFDGLDVPGTLKMEAPLLPKEPVKGDYSMLKDSKTVKESAPFTQTQKQNILQENMNRNGGVIKSDLSGQQLDKPTKSVKGQKANMNQAEIDHKTAKSKGG